MHPMGYVYNVYLYKMCRAFFGWNASKNDNIVLKVGLQYLADLGSQKCLGRSKKTRPPVHVEDGKRFFNTGIYRP